MKKLIWILTIAVVLLSVALVAPRLIASSSDAPEELSLNTSSSGAPASSAPAATGNSSDAQASTDLDGSWQVQQPSEAGYRLDEVLSGANVTVVGRTTQVSGKIEVAGEKLQSAAIDVDLASIATDSGNRDNYFRETLEVSQYPKATIEITEPVDLSQVRDGETVNSTVPATVKIKDVTRQYDLSVAIRQSGDTVEVQGSFPIVFQDFGVTAPNLGFVQVEDHGTIEFLVSLKQ